MFSNRIQYRKKYSLTFFMSDDTMQIESATDKTLDLEVDDNRLIQ